MSSKTIAIKIVVEDHQAEVVDGMEALLPNNRCCIQMECFDYNIGAIQPRMKGLGYPLVRSIDVGQVFRQFLIIFLRWARGL